MSIVFKEETLASIPTPASGKTALFVDDNDNRLKRKDDAGNVVDIEVAATGVTSFEARTGAVTAQAGDYIASEITNTPAGNIAATDVQAALNELDTEKLGTAHAGSGGSAHAQVTTSVDGFMIAADKTKLDGVEAGATANSSDAALLDRANHTGTQAAATVTGTAGNFARFNSSGLLENAPDYSFDDNTGGINRSVIYQPDNGGSATLDSHTFNFDPLQNSDNESVGLRQFNIGFDVNSSGFSQGRNGEAASHFSTNYTHLGTGDIGSFSYIKNSFNIGNGVDAINVAGMAYAYGFGSFNDGVNIDGPLQGYGFQPSATSGVTMDASTYVNAFYDYSNFACAVPGWTTFNSSPTLAEIQNNKNYNGINFNPNIPVFTGNAGATVIGVFGTYGTFGASGYFNAININPTVTSVPSATGVYVDMTNVNATSYKRAIDVVGDVSINGALNFTGALTIGQLNAFYGVNPVDGGGNPQTIHGLVSQMTALNGVTTANADAIGVNTVMLVELQANSINTSGPSQLGFTALAIPCVVATHTGSTLDYMSGATFAINLDGASTGGTIDKLRIARSVPIPNGITTINNSYGWYYHEPFGGVATNSWGFYNEALNDNFMRQSLKIGGVVDSTDKVTNASVAFEIEHTDRVALLSRLTSAQEGALTALDGMIHYNTDTNKFRGRAGGAWVDLH